MFRSSICFNFVWGCRVVRVQSKCLENLLLQRNEKIDVRMIFSLVREKGKFLRCYDWDTVVGEVISLFILHVMSFIIKISCVLMVV